jgi:hypothetical protein
MLKIGPRFGCEWIKAPTRSHSIICRTDPLRAQVTGRRYDIVLDVPTNATDISFGVLLSGSGEVWLNEAKVEVIGAVLPTNEKINAVSNEPTNLDFRE